MESEFSRLRLLQLRSFLEGYSALARRLREIRHGTFARHELAICAIFRDEARYLDEWIEFHLHNGVEKFYLINHKSQDNYLQVLRPWIDKKVVTLIDATADDQLGEYNKVLSEFGQEVRWLAFIDIDEFLFSPTNLKLTVILKDFKKHAAVFVYWRLFGSGNREKPVGEEGVLKGFRTCLSPPSNSLELEQQRDIHRSIRSDTMMTGAPIQGKCIVRPSRVSKVSVHWPEKFDGQVSDESGNLSQSHFPRLRPPALPKSNLLRINHYWSRSLSELRSKSLREPVHRGLRYNKNLKSLPGQRSEEWDQHLNHSLDTAALENFHNDLPFVFLIGFNKTATRSFHDFFEKNGFPAVHWDKNRLVQRMLENRNEGNRLLLGYEDYRVFSDLTYITDDAYFEANALFDQLHRDYPSAFFILNNRSTDSWIRSRLSQNRGIFANRHLAIRGLSSYQELANAWSAEKAAHEERVRAYFAGHKRFIEIHIEDPEVPDQLARLMNRDFVYRSWPVIRNLRGVKSPP
jgi:hypothetical protein